VITFSAETYQNEYLPAGGTEINAVVTVRASGAPETPTDIDAAEVVIIDTSGSMAGRKLRAAQEATAAAIDCIRAGVSFGVIAGTDTARVAWPRDTLVAASESTRSKAKAAVSKLEAGGGTAIGTWLTLANELFATSPDGIRHAILLTDGKNESETETELDTALEACSGHFHCD